MKKAISIPTTEQVTANLRRLFGKDECECTSIEEMDVYGTKIILFFLKFPSANLVVDSKKQIYQNGNLEQYFSDCLWYRLPVIIKEFNGVKHFPYGYLAKRLSNQTELKDNVSKMLIACGLKKEPVETDVKRLQKLAGSSYAQFYKLIQQVNVKKAGFVTKEKDYIGYGEYSFIWVLKVEHESGSFSFPIENINGNNEYAEIQNIFFNLLGLPLANQELLAA